MAKRLFDIAAALAALLVLSPILLLAALGIRLSSRGPILYCALRAGKDGRPFTMHKFRTMALSQSKDASAITSSNDQRVFPFGKVLRRLKIDELPQLFDVLRGSMTIVGPRPEDLQIVSKHYAPEHLETLRVRPGLASPGSIYNYTHGERLIGSEQPERDYLVNLLPVKLALDHVYVRNASMLYDLRLIGRTLWIILQIGLGRASFPEPPEMAKIPRIVPARSVPRRSEASSVVLGFELAQEVGLDAVLPDLRDAA